jgi:hypothetical protein
MRHFIKRMKKFTKKENWRDFQMESRLLGIHAGMGDTIVCAGMAVKLSEFYDITIPCREKYLQSVRSFFVNYPNVNVIKLEYFNDLIEKHSSIKTGCYNSDIPWKNNEEDFCHWFYRAANIDYEVSFSHCPLKEAIKYVEQLPVPEKPYIFLHEGGNNKDRWIDRGLIRRYCSTYDIYIPEEKGNILAYAEIIRNARQVHCIDSGFFHLCERIDTTGDLYYHRYTKDSSEYYRPFKKNWTIL